MNYHGSMNYINSISDNQDEQVKAKKKIKGKRQDKKKNDFSDIHLDLEKLSLNPKASKNNKVKSKKSKNPGKNKIQDTDSIQENSFGENFAINQNLLSSNNLLMNPYQDNFNFNENNYQMNPYFNPIPNPMYGNTNNYMSYDPYYYNGFNNPNMYNSTTNPSNYYIYNNYSIYPNNANPMQNLNNPDYFMPENPFYQNKPYPYNPSLDQRNNEQSLGMTTPTYKLSEQNMPFIDKQKYPHFYKNKNQNINYNVVGSMDSMTPQGGNMGNYNYYSNSLYTPPNSTNTNNNLNELKMTIRRMNLRSRNDMTDQYIFSNIMTLSQSNDLSIFICEIINYKVQKSDIDLIILYEYLKPFFVELSTSNFGTYIIQKVIKLAHIECIDKILVDVVANFEILAFSPYGTRVIQLLIECLSYSNHVNQIANLIQTKFLVLARHCNSIFIIYSFAKKFIGDQSNFIYQAFIDNCLDICCNKFGTCLIQKCIDLVTKSPKEAELIKLLIQNGLKLLENCYGNYVIQCLVKNYESYVNECKLIFDLIIHNIRYLGKLQYSSSFVEKILLNPKHHEFKLSLAEKILDEDILLELLMNQNGNYIIHKLLKKIEEPLYSRLISLIGTNFNKLQSSNLSKKVIKKLITEHKGLEEYYSDNEKNEVKDSIGSLKDDDNNKSFD